MSNQTKYRCAHEHPNHKCGEVITAEQYQYVKHPEYWVPVTSDEVLKSMKAEREKLVNRNEIVKK